MGSQQRESSVKFLGIHLDEHLTWKPHLNHINSKIARALFAIKQAKHSLPPDSLKSLYFALIEPLLNYGILAWGKAYRISISRTEILQKRAIRIIHRSQYNSHTEPLFKISEILKLYDLYEYQASVFMYDMYHKKLPPSFHNMYKTNHEIHGNRLTRQSNLLYVERGITSFSKTLPFYNLPEIWNRWSCRVSANVTRSVFKKYVRSNLLSRYSSSVRCTNLYCKSCRPTL